MLEPKFIRRERSDILTSKGPGLKKKKSMEKRSSNDLFSTD